jgi:hypothetical protein
MTPTDYREVRWVIPVDPVDLASFWEGEQPELYNRFGTETYVPKKLGLFGRTLTVMVERSVLWNDFQIEKWATEFLISSLARALMTQDGGH